MRYLKGLVGAWLGVFAGFVTMGIVNDTMRYMAHEIGMAWLLVTAVAVFSSLVGRLSERPEWTVWRHAANGVMTAGGLMMALFAFTVLADENTTLQIVKAICFSGLIGAFAGFGYFGLARSSPLAPRS